METVNNKQTKAVELLCQAAEEGCEEASHLLGKMLVAGQLFCVGAKAREIRILALKPFSNRHPHAAVGASHAVLVAVHRQRAGKALPHPARAARERRTENPVRLDDGWTDNQYIRGRM